MADNLTTTTTVSTIPNGTVIATDDAGAGGHVQIVKLAISTDGSATAIPAEATNGLDVDVTRVIPGTSATHLGKAEDAAHASGDTGVMALAVQQTADAALAGTTGDYAPLQVDETGYLKVNVKTGGTAGTQYVEDAAAAADPTGTVLNLVRNDTPATTTVSADGDNIAARANSAGAQYVELLSGAAKVGGDATNGLDVDVTRVSGTVTISGAVTNAGTFVTQENGAALTALQLIDDPVIVDDAAVTAATTKVMMQGAMAVAHGSAPDAADAGDGGMVLMNRHRVQWTIGGHPNAKSATYITTAAGTDDNVMAAIAAGTKYAVTRITITLDEATTVGVGVRLGFGAASVPALGASQADAVDDILVYHPGLVPGGGITIGDGSGVLGVGGDGAELRITNEVPTSGTLAVTVTYFTIES